MSELTGVKKFGYSFFVSEEMAAPYDRSERRRLQDEALMAQMRAKRLANRPVVATFLAALDAVADPLARRVLDLHHREADTPWLTDWTCQGCDFLGYEGEPPYWPCSTVTTVCEHIGIDVPETVESPRPYDDEESK